jgi:hypothetical protein
MHFYCLASRAWLAGDAACFYDCIHFLRGLALRGKFVSINSQMDDLAVAN